MPAACCLLPAAYCLLPTAYRLLPTAYCLLPTAYYSPLPYAFPNSRSSVSGFGRGVSRLTTTSRPMEMSAAG